MALAIKVAPVLLAVAALSLGGCAAGDDEPAPAPAPASEASSVQPDLMKSSGGLGETCGGGTFSCAGQICCPADALCCTASSSTGGFKAYCCAGTL